MQKPAIMVRRACVLRLAQKLNVASSSIFRFAAALENGPLTRAIDFPKSCEVNVPIGVAAFTLLRMFLALTLKVRL